MIECSIKGCGAVVSEILGEDFVLKHWIMVRACRCGAWDSRNPQACKCQPPEGSRVPMSYWPNLDWWMFGGVEEVVLCPFHKSEVYDEILHQRGIDSSMNPEKPSPYNRH